MEWITEIETSYQKELTPHSLREYLGKNRVYEGEVMQHFFGDNWGKMMKNKNNPWSILHKIAEEANVKYINCGYNTYDLIAR